VAVVQTLDHRGHRHGPKLEIDGEEDSTMLMDTTMKNGMPPRTWPQRQDMKRSQASFRSDAEQVLQR
jgi:hypothetical protein